VSDPFAGAEPTLPTYAGWGRRLAAVVIDNLLVSLPFVATFVAAIVALEQSNDESDAAGLAILLSWAAWVVVPFVYFTVLHGRPGGQTLGKRLLGIRVIGEDFRPIGYGRAFGRFAIGWVMWLACYVPGILDALWPLWDQKKQAIHDKVVNSMVVRV
jgi:uncharacterized RDD family membrane protein YckC